MEVILNGHVIFVTIHWTYANIYIGDSKKFSRSARVSARMLGFSGLPLLQTSWPPLMEVPNCPPPLCCLLKSNLSCAWFPTALLLAFQKRVSIYMKLSNTIFRSKFDEDDNEERLLIDELLPQGKGNLFENATRD